MVSVFTFESMEMLRKGKEEMYFKKIMFTKIFSVLICALMLCVDRYHLNSQLYRKHGYDQLHNLYYTLF